LWKNDSYSDNSRKRKNKQENQNGSKTGTEAFNAHLHDIWFTVNYTLSIVYAPLFLQEAARAQPKVLLIMPLAQPCSSCCFLLYCSSLALVHDGL
jgi:hypothetical protein